MSLDHLSNAPSSDAPTLRPAIAEYLAYVQDLVDDTEVYGYAVSTLRGIAETIRLTGRVTDGQKQAVRNIVNGAAEAQDARERNRRSRRYEGWSR